MEAVDMEKGLEELLQAFKNKDNNFICLKKINTPLGLVYACSIDECICFLEFADVKKTYSKLNALAKDLKTGIIIRNTPVLNKLEQELEEYFAKRRQIFSVPLHPCGSDFQKEVWKALCTIPYGHVISYKEQAQLLHNPNAVRAVANANGRNKIAIIIPCHRVVGSDNSLTGYAGGIWRKQQLLELEQNTQYI